MAFKRAEMDNPRHRQTLADMILEGIKEDLEKRSREDFQRVRDRLWRSLEKVDTAMTRIIMQYGNENDLIIWAAEKDVQLQLGLQRLDQSLEQYGTPHWAASSMERFITLESYLDAALQGVNMTFAQYNTSLNEVLSAA